MKTILLNAKVLNKSEQKSVNGGMLPQGCSFVCRKTGDVTSGSNCSKPACGGCNTVCA